MPAISRLDEWLKRTCCCKHPDEYSCGRLRDNPPGRPPEVEDSEPCDCVCHKDWDEHWEDDLASD